MTFEDYGIAAEILASVATLLALFYLAVQIRTASRAQIADSRRTGHDRAAMLAITIGQSTETAGVWRRGLWEFESLSTDEKVQFIFLFSQLVSQTDLAYADHRLGLSERNHFEETSGVTFDMLRMPGGRAYWEYSKNSYSKDFRNYIDQKVLQAI